MPTIVLLDTSLSMRRPASKTNRVESRHSLACRGLEWFFEYLNKAFHCEYTSLHAFSSGCETIATFTRDYKQLISKLADIPFCDRTDLRSALVTVVEVVMAEWGAFAPCQVIVVTDGLPGVRHQDASHRKQVLNIPFSCQLNVVCICTKDELTESNIERLCETADITPSEIFVPVAPLNAESVQGAFKEVAKACFVPFVSVLKCGHLQSKVSLFPSPAMYKAKYDIVISADNRFPKLDDSLGKAQFPSKMDICGFLDNCSIPAPPHYSRHFVLDPEVDEKCLEQGSSLLSPTGSSHEDKPAVGGAPVTDAAQKPSFRVLLHGSLKCESKSALVKLGERWYGFLFSQTSTSKKANLVLCVLYPDAELPWLGKMSYLGPKPQVDISDPRMQPAAAEASHFPVEPPHLPSFHTPSNLFWAKESVLQQPLLGQGVSVMVAAMSHTPSNLFWAEGSVLQTDVSKVIRYSRKLPDKETSLLKELNKLRLVALTYCMPELLEVICTVLGKEQQGATNNQQSQTLLKQCIYFLTHNKNPQDRLVIK